MRKMRKKDSEWMAADAQHGAIGVGGRRSAETNHHPEAQWFGEQKLGLFVHWGISSVQGEVDLSWGMIKDKPWGGASIPPEQYWASAKDFQPDRYEPERYLEKVAAAGFEYAVLTTKHHDGYLMWPAEQSEFGTAIHMGGRDLVEPFIKACRNFGLKVGLYYSPPDWYFSRDYLLFDYQGLKLSGQEPAEPVKGLGMSYEEKVSHASTPEFVAKRRDYIRSHIFELLKRWGRIDLLWFDGRGLPASEPAFMELDEIRERQPWIVVNDRLTGSGDYVTFECQNAEEVPDGWWEKCHLWNRGGWGYINHEKYWDGEDIYRDFQHTYQAGGNYLINAAPRPNGAMPDAFYRELEIFEQCQCV